jgi:hypothetical protein
MRSRVPRSGVRLERAVASGLHDISDRTTSQTKVHCPAAPVSVTAEAEQVAGRNEGSREAEFDAGSVGSEVPKHVRRPSRRWTRPEWISG